MSEDTVTKGTEIFKALFRVQKKLKGVVKDSTNSHFKNSYADRTSILEAIRPLFEEEGLLLIQSPVIPPPTESGEVNLAFTTAIIHVESGEAYQSTALVPLPKADPQGFGSAVTYTSRYTLTMILGLPLLDDDGNAGSGNTTRPNVTKGKGTNGGKSNPPSVAGAAASTQGAQPTASTTSAKSEPSQTGTAPTTNAPPAAPTSGKRKLWGSA